MATSPTLPASAIGVQDFLRILVAQLSYQDPLKPMDPQQFVSQLAQFTALQQTQEINEKVATLVSAQGAIQSVGMLGKTVDVLVGATARTGVVEAIAFNNGMPRLTVQLSSGDVLNDVTLSNVLTIR
jgi:flagellar basal-body rod modification protein FlgD